MLVLVHVLNEVIHFAHARVIVHLQVSKKFSASLYFFLEFFAEDFLLLNVLIVENESLCTDSKDLIVIIGEYLPRIWLLQVAISRFFLEYGTFFICHVDISKLRLVSKILINAKLISK